MGLRDEAAKEHAEHPWLTRRQAERVADDHIREEQTMDEMHKAARSKALGDLRKWAEDEEGKRFKVMIGIGADKTPEHEAAETPEEENEEHLLGEEAPDEPSEGEDEEDTALVEAGPAKVNPPEISLGKKKDAELPEAELPVYRGEPKNEEPAVASADDQKRKDRLFRMFGGKR